jgi:phage shock protein E
MRRLSRCRVVALLVVVPAVVILPAFLFAFGTPATGPLSAVPGMPGMGAANRADAPERRVAVPGDSYGEIAPETLAERLAREDFALINVHIPDEGQIAGTDRAIPYDRIGDASAQLPADRGAAIILYCRTGRMSAEAATTLVRLGYRNVSHLAGGFEAWRARGFLVTTRP